MVLGLCGCLVLFILIIIGISACTAGITGNLGGNSSKETNKTHKIGETVKMVILKSQLIQWKL